MRAWLEVDIGKLARNYGAVKSYINRPVPGSESGRNDRGILAVVKSDAYGHGIDRISKELDRLGVSGFAVITLDEALAVQATSNRDVLVMGYLDEQEIGEAIRAGMCLSLYDPELAAVYSMIARKLGLPARVQLKVETGLNRLGVQIEDAVKLLDTWQRYGNLKLEGVYSHLSTSSDRATDLDQNVEFREFLDRVPEVHKEVPLHLCNSHGIRQFSEGFFDQVRVGLALYGVEEVLPGLEPTLECKTVVMQRKRIKAGQGVSYNKLFRAPRDMDIAVIAIGYAEGLSQALTGKMFALINGYKVPVIGQICMNLCVINVDGVPAQRGDEVTLIGSQLGVNGEHLSITVSEMAKAAGIRHHEIITRLGLSLPRIYLSTPGSAAVQVEVGSPTRSAV